MKKPVHPTPSQLEWADAEIGVIIHFDMQVFEPGYSFRKQWGYTPSPGIFNPAALDTDQWIESAVAAGAGYAVLVAKHCSGFSLWPTRAHDYHVGNTPWRNGQGDIVADFFASCRKFGIKPGLYCSAATNAYLNVDNPGRVRSGNAQEQEAYNRIVETQLTELWTNYGDVFEIWFDGGVIPPQDGGPDIVPLLERLQPNAVVFQGPRGWPSLLRWVGNERGEAPDPCWSTTSQTTSEDGTEEKNGMGGDPDGEIWAPGESDMPNRDQTRAFQGGWFWRDGDEQYLYSLEHLTERYFSSVGRNTNLLLGMVIDPRGLVPDADQRRFAEFGSRLKELFSTPLGETAGTGKVLSLAVPDDRPANMLVLMEDIANGERIREFTVEARIADNWVNLYKGRCIGHKRIVRFNPTAAPEFRLTVSKCSHEPQIREFGVYSVQGGW